MFRIIIFYILASFVLLFPYLPYSSFIVKSMMPFVLAIFAFHYFIFDESKRVSSIFLLFITMIYDSLNNYLIGTTGLFLFLSLYIFYFQKVIFNMRRIEEASFGFAVFFIEFSIIKLVLLSFLDSEGVNFLSLIGNYFVTILLYPLFHIFLRKIARLLGKEDRSYNVG